LLNSFIIQHGQIMEYQDSEIRCYYSDKKFDYMTTWTMDHQSFTAGKTNLYTNNLYVFK